MITDCWKFMLHATAVSLFFGCLAAAGQAEEAPALPLPERAGYESFRLIVERNIFNANRQKARPVQPVRERQEAPKVTQFTLIGTLITEASSYAFFSGTEPEFNGVFELGDTIAGRVITGIRSNGITLAGDNPVLLLEVGKGLRRVGDGEWEPIAGREAARPGPPITQSQTGPAASAGDTRADSAQTPAGAPDSDILRRMMEKRRQELGQ